MTSKEAEKAKKATTGPKGRPARLSGSVFSAFLFAFLLAGAFVLPDYFVKLFVPAYAARFNANSFGYVFAFSAFLLFVRSNLFFYCALALAWMLLFGGFFYYMYFGRYFLGGDVRQLFVETEDIFVSAVAYLPRIWPLFAAIGIAAAASVAVRRGFKKRFSGSNAFILLFMLAVLQVPYRVAKNGSTYTLPNSLYYMLFNSIKSMSSYFVNIAFRGDGEAKKFLPYEVKKVREAEDGTTIVVVMGESLNPERMSLFGAARDTTPRLKEFAGKDGNFYYTRGVSSSVATGISNPMFYNLQKEPENYLLIQTKENNLFRHAKETGFRTYFLSAQSLSAIPNIGLEFADTSLYKDKARREIARKGDDFWLEKLKELPLDAGKNFVVIQNRVAHDPYPRAYEHKREKYSIYDGEDDDARMSEYDNGLRYFDDLTADMLEYLSGLPGRVYFVLVSDHGELFGEDGVWGHVFLHRGVANIPIILWTNRGGGEFSAIKSMPYPSHYDAGKLVLSLLGYSVLNPNTPEDVIYIQGMDISGSQGFIKYKREAGRLVEIERR